MAYKKRTTSPELEKAQIRSAGIEQFDPDFDFGNGLTKTVYLEGMNLVAELTKKNNDLLTEVDGNSTALDLAEKALANLSSRVLSGVASKYTTDSIEYEKAGGVRSSEIKRGRKNNNVPAAK